MMIYEKISKLIPFVSENFITFPLWEEGNYTPFIYFWLSVNDQYQFDLLGEKIEEFNVKNTGFEIAIINEVSRSKVIEMQMNPKYGTSKRGGIIYKNKSWSIEQMLTHILLFNQWFNANKDL